jgi:hypothetical protein
MARSNDVMAEEAELSCALLLGEREETEFLVCQMAEEKLQAVRTWPIWKLRRGTEPSDATDQ